MKHSYVRFQDSPNVNIYIFPYLCDHILSLPIYAHTYAHIYV